MRKFQTIAIAGTFDRLHKGHRFFISEAFKLGEKVIIGLTSDEYADKKIKRLRHTGSGHSPSPGVEEFVTRKKELEEFLAEKGLLNRTQIVKIDDVYGPAIERDDIEALVVTSETLRGGEMVNTKRRELGLKPLQLLKVPLILAEDKKRIASTRIRIGEIDRWGRVFELRIANHQSRISEELRKELKKPLGELIKGDPDNLLSIAEKLEKTIATISPIMISTVGDEVTRVCNEIGITVNLAIFDYRVGRKEKYHSLDELGFGSHHTNSSYSMKMYGLAVDIRNPAGHITKELVSAVNNAYFGIIKDHKQRIIKVEGEEDLAGVPAVLLAPLGSVVLYGQPTFIPIQSGLRRGKLESGVVVVEITEKMKQKLLSLIDLYHHNN